MPTQPVRHTVSLTAVEGLRHDIDDLFQVSNTTLDHPHAGQVRFRGQFLKDPANCFDELRKRFAVYDFIPLVQHDGDQPALFAKPIPYQPQQTDRYINLFLLIVTILSTLLVGTMSEVAEIDELYQLWRGLPFCLSILLILGAHELGHFLVARYHKTPLSDPFIVPLPLSTIGTLGAFTRLRAPANNRRVLFDIFAFGPWLGFLVTIPILIIGLLTSEVGPLPVNEGYQLEGNSILYALIKYAVFGQMLPGNGLDVQLNQVAWAGWVGLLITGINLLPVMQLDGGPITSILFGNQIKRLHWPIIVMLGILVFLTGAFTWVILIAILMFLPPIYSEPLDEITELDTWRKVVAALTLLLFFLTFVPIPLTQVVP